MSLSEQRNNDLCAINGTPMEENVTTNRVNVNKVSKQLNNMDHLARSDIQQEWLLIEQNELKLTEINEKLDKLDKKRNEALQLIQNIDKAKEDLKKNGEIIVLKTVELRKQRTFFYRLNRMVAHGEKYGLEKLMNDLKQYIEEISNNIQECIDASRAQKEKDIVEYRKHCETYLVPMMEKLKLELKLLNRNKAQIEHVMRANNRQQDENRNEIHSKNEQMTSVKAMPQLISEIKVAHDQGKFSQLPRGPIGSYITVPNSQYLDVVESVIGADLLTAFIVDNLDDKLTLETILSTYSNKSPRIITEKFRKQEHYIPSIIPANSVWTLDIPYVDPPPETLVLLHLIKCADEVVMDYLIYCPKIGTVLLTNNKNMAEEFTSNRNKVPNGLSKIIVLCTGNIAYEYYPKQEYRTCSLKIKKANYIQVNFEDRLRLLEKEKQTLENKCHKLDNVLKCLHQRHPQVLKYIQENLELLKKSENDHCKLQETIDELKNVEYADYIYSSEIKRLQNMLEEAKVRLKEVKSKINYKSIEISESASEKDRFEREHNSRNDEVRKIRNEIEYYRKYRILLINSLFPLYPLLH